MSIVIDIWLSIPDFYRNKIIWIAAFALPPLSVFLLKNKWFKYILRILLFVVVGIFNDYAVCSKKIVFCNPQYSKEIFPYLFIISIGFLYCLLIEFVLWIVKNLKDYLRNN